MHELGMCEAIVAATLHRAAGRRVTNLRVRVGGHAVDPDVVTQGIQLAAAGTVAQSADIDLILVPMSMSCGDCGHTGTIANHLAMVACPSCGGLDIQVAGDEDVMLESITVAAGDGSGCEMNNRPRERARG